MLRRPSSFADGNRQRLLDLKQRLTAVQRLGDEYARVELSEHVRSVLGQGAFPKDDLSPLGKRAAVSA